MRLWRSTRSKHRQRVDEFLGRLTPPRWGDLVLRVGWSGRERSFGGIRLNIQPVPGVQVVADATALPFKDDTFDYVSCIEMAYLLGQNRKVLAEEIKRVIKNRGRVVVTEPSPSFIPQDDTLFNRVEPLFWFVALGGIYSQDSQWGSGWGIIVDVWKH